MPRLSTLLAAALLAAGACTPAGSATTVATPMTRATAVAAAGSDDDRYSVYDLDAEWRDQQGRPRTLASLRARSAASATRSCT